MLYSYPGNPNPEKLILTQNVFLILTVENEFLMCTQHILK